MRSECIVMKAMGTLCMIIIIMIIIITHNNKFALSLSPVSKSSEDYVCIILIFYRFKLELDPNHPVKHEIIVVMKTEDGIMMKATPRVRHS